MATAFTVNLKRIEMKNGRAVAHFELFPWGSVSIELGIRGPSVMDGTSKVAWTELERSLATWLKMAGTHARGAQRQEN